MNQNSVEIGDQIAVCNDSKKLNKTKSNCSTLRYGIVIDKVVGRYGYKYKCKILSFNFKLNRFDTLIVSNISEDRLIKLDHNLLDILNISYA